MCTKWGYENHVFELFSCAYYFHLRTKSFKLNNFYPPTASYSLRAALQGQFHSIRWINPFGVWTEMSCVVQSKKVILDIQPVSGWAGKYYVFIDYMSLRTLLIYSCITCDLQSSMLNVLRCRVSFYYLFVCFEGFEGFFLGTF